MNHETGPKKDIISVKEREQQVLDSVRVRRSLQMQSCLQPLRPEKIALTQRIQDFSHSFSEAARCKIFLNQEGDRTQNRIRSHTQHKG